MSTLEQNELTQLMSRIDAQWNLIDEHFLSRRFRFSGFDEVVNFVIQVASIASELNHHPDVQFGYNYCVVKYTTYETSSLTLKDFQCIKKIDEL